MDNFQKFKDGLDDIYNNNKLYRKKMDELNIKLDDINSFKDISKLPFTTKEDFFIEEDNPYLLHKDKIKMYHASSGSTGKPLIVGLSENDLKLRNEHMKENALMMGMKKDDCVILNLGMGMFTGGLTFYEGYKEFGATILPTSTLPVEKQLYYMKKIKPDVLITSPSQAMHIAVSAKNMGFDVKKLNLRIIRVGSEILTENTREKIKLAYNAEVTQDYGMTEALGPGLAMECKYGCGLHLNENSFYFELINPKTGKITKSNHGELVVTSINTECFKLIRYRTRDLVEITKDTCECGRQTPRIIKFLGRVDDMVKVKGVKVYISQAEDFLYKHKYLDYYEMTITKDDYKDILTINVEYNNLPDEKDKVKRMLEKEFKNEFGISAIINLLEYNTLIRHSGKVKRIRDYREK